jgi:hypothetical protein
MIRARGILNVDEEAVVSVSKHDCGDLMPRRAHRHPDHEAGSADEGDQDQ